MKSFVLFPDKQLIDQMNRDDGRVMSILLSKDYLDDEFDTGEEPQEEEEQTVEENEDEEDV